MAIPLPQKNLKIIPQSQTILQRIANADKSAADECLNVYGDFVWQLVRKYSQSDADAGKMVQEVFNDIWEYARRYDSAKLSENDFISMLVRHRLRQKNIH